MLEKLFEILKNRKKEKQLNEPKYKISELYIADIVLLKEHFYSGDTSNYKFKNIKQNAILVHSNWSSFIHIKSGQKLKDMFWSSVNDYALNNVKHFREKLAVYMRVHNLTEDSKLSVKQILELEEALQHEKLDELINHNLFN